MENFIEYILAIIEYPLCFITPVFMLKTASKFLQPRHGKFFAVIRYVTLCLACFMVIYIGDFVNIIYTMPLFFLGIWLSYSSSAHARLSMSMVLFSLTMSLNAMIDSFDFLPYYPYIYRTLVWAAIWLICSKYMNSERYSLSSKMWNLIGILALLPFATTITAVALVGEYAYLVSAATIVSIVVLPFVFIFSVSLLFTVTVLANNETAIQENKLYEMRNIYYKNLEQEQLRVRRLRHDMANHLTAIDGLLREEKYGRAEEYIASLRSAPGMLTMKRYCKDDTVNSLLAGKVSVMESGSIPYELNVDLPESLPVEGLDLCSLIGNALDNAIEASVKLPEGERIVTFSMAVRKGMFILNAVNNMPPLPSAKNGRFKTTKADKSLHGLGLENMRFIAGKYGGVMEIKTENGKFDLLITFPI